MRVVPIPCLADNYAWWLPDEGAVVDPSEAGPVLAALGGAPLRAIWLTHHHWDHVGGVLELKAHFPGLRVYASAWDLSRIEGADVGLVEGDEVGPMRILAVPGHTLGAIAWVGEDVVFTGDTLFAAGCGRLFEGEPAQMVASLAKLRALPDALRVACGHDYTEKNCRFGASVDPGWTRTPAPLPSRLGDEKRSNVFLRWDDAALAAHHGVATGVPLFTRLRALRNDF